MRIVYLLTSLGVGGAEKQALAVAERMATRGHTVQIMVLMPRLDEEWPTDLHTNSPRCAQIARQRVQRLLARARVSARVPAGSGAQPLLSREHLRPPAPFLRSRNSSLLSTVHNVYEGGWGRMMAYRLTDFLSGRTVAVSQAAADRFIAPQSDSTAKMHGHFEWNRRRGFAPSSRARGKNARRDGDRDREPQHLSGSPWAASLRQRTIRICCAAFAAAVHAEKSDAQLWVAGDARGDEKKPLETLAKDFEIDAAVRWLGLRRDMPALLDAADAFVSSSAWEGMPLAVGEAMAMAKPVGRHRCGRRTRAGRRCRRRRPAEKSTSTRRSDVRDHAAEQGSARRKWPGCARTHLAPLQHGRNRRYVGGIVRIADPESRIANRAIVKQNE